MSIRPSTTLIVFSFTCLITTAGSAYASPSVLVLSRGNNKILEYDAQSGLFLREFASGGLIHVPGDICAGSDGTVYVSNFNDNIIRFSHDGAPLGELVNFRSTNQVVDLEFGPDGKLYSLVKLNSTEGSIVRIDTVTGVSETVFPHIDGSIFTGFTFGADGKLYISDLLQDRVWRYDLGSGVLSAFAAFGGNANPDMLTFGPSGNLFVRSTIPTNSIREFDGASGAYIREFVSSGSGGLSVFADPTFGPDGNLYLTGVNADVVNQYDGITGAFIESLIQPGSGGLDEPSGILFVPEPCTGLMLCFALALLQIRRPRSRWAKGRAT